MLQTIFCLIIVGLLWGATTPFIRRSSDGLEKIDTGSKWSNLFMELKLITSRLNYWIPFILNQLGSFFYVWTLQSTSIIAAVPIANSLSFVFTAITGYMLGERLPGKKVLIGSLLICVGSSLVLYDRYLQQEKPSK